MLAEGETLNEEPVPSPLSQAYVLPPLPLIVVLFPEQITGVVTDAEIVGIEFTVTVT
ncbi:hypothetical protein SDC9_189396 [bioreactor metagenome]|uniref:Uncharacterized protein n=1 Tax=bioreactor metagenome TaxID=1076179 RepID=A0A645HS22_9ZZZZ